MAASSFLGLNSSNQVVLSASSLTPAAGSSGNIQYNGGSGFAANAGLNVSTTRGGIDFLANVTTANLLSLGDNGADATSYALGESALLAQSTTNLDNTAIGGYALTAVTTGLEKHRSWMGCGTESSLPERINTIIGALVASTTLTTGTNNILIGVDNTVDTAATSTTSTLNIGNLLGGVLTNATHASQYPLTLTATGSGVNGVKIQNAPTGQAAIITATGTDTNGVGLGLQILATNATTTGNGGGLSILSGNAFGSGSGGSITLKGGSPLTAGTGGSVTISGGDANSNTNGGSVTVEGGAANNSGAGGLTLKTQNAGGGSQSGPTLALLSGNGVATSGGGGPITITNGNGASTNGNGGSFSQTSGNGTGAGAGGNSSLTGGNGGATGVGGNAVITSGNGGATSGVAGSINLNLGTTTSSAGGTLPSINSGGFLAFTTTQAPIATKTGIHSTVANSISLTTSGIDALTVDVAGNKTSLGSGSLAAVTTGAFNTAIGYGSGALITTGTGNTILGYNAGSTTVLTIGSDNILIGQGVAATTSSDTNTINIGGIYKATGIGTPSTSQATIAGALNVTATLQQGIELSCATGLTTDGSGNINGCVASDASLKTNIQPLVYDATLIDRLQPVSYAWREPAVTTIKNMAASLPSKFKLSIR